MNAIILVTMTESFIPPCIDNPRNIICPDNCPLLNPVIGQWIMIRDDLVQRELDKGLSEKVAINQAGLRVLQLVRGEERLPDDLAGQHNNAFFRYLKLKDLDITQCIHQED